MHRPALVPVPALALQLLLGREMADTLLLGGQRALPAKAQQLGYQFRFADVESALRHIFQ
jgi:NAD dependent epimerase/dehydratase family enzyme